MSSTEVSIIDSLTNPMESYTGNIENKDRSNNEQIMKMVPITIHTTVNGVTETVIHEVPEEDLKEEYKIVSNSETSPVPADDIRALKRQIRQKEVEEETNNLTQIIKSMNLQSPEQIAEFTRQFTANALGQKFDGDALSLFTSIKKVRKTVGLLNKDEMVCEFYINDKILYVPIEKTRTPHYFLDQYVRTFNIFLSIKNKEWLGMMNALFRDMEIVEAPEESEHVFIARETWSQICKFKVSDDPTGFKANKGILKKEGKYYVTSKTITKLTEKTKIRMNDLSGAMTQLGMKTPGTTKQLKIRCWELLESALKSEGVI